MQRYIERTTRLLELEHSEKVILRQQVEEQKRLLDTRKERSKGKRIAVKGLLDSSPPDGTDLRSANALLNSALKEIQQVPAIMQRYIERTTRLLELEHSEKVILRQQVEEQKRLLDTRKERSKGKRIAVKGQFVFSTEEILKKVEECEAETVAKKAGKQARKRVIDEILEDNEIDGLENTYSQPESDCIVVAVRK